MPPALLESQLATLEPLAADEPGIVVDIGPDVVTVIATAVGQIRALAGAGQGIAQRADHECSGR